MRIRLCVIDGHGLADRRPRRIGGKVRHAAGKRRRHRQAAGVRMVLHVIDGRMREHDLRRDLANHRRRPWPASAGRRRFPGRCRCFRETRRRLPWPRHTLPRGECGRSSPRRTCSSRSSRWPGSNNESCSRRSRRQHQRAGHEELDVVGMGGDGDGGFIGQRSEVRNQRPEVRGQYVSNGQSV